MDLIYRYADSMTIRLSNALEHGNLANMIVLEAAAPERDTAVLELGNKMSNKAFRLIYKRIMDCSTVEDKMILLTKYIHSYDDFLDLLKSDCFYEKEYDDVFRSLGDIELSALITNEFKEYMLRGENKLSILFAKNISYRYDWEKAFVDWLKNLDIDRTHDIELIVHKNQAAEII
jgi:hypothetical protein